MSAHKCRSYASAATSDEQSILEIPVTDEIHMEDQNHGLD